MECVLLEMLYQKYRTIGKISENVEDTYFPGGLWKSLAENDFWKIPVPVAFGGLGYGWMQWFTALENLLSVYRSTSFYFRLARHASLLYFAVKYLLEGSEQQHMVDRLLQGTPIHETELFQQNPEAIGIIDFLYFQAGIHAFLTMHFLQPLLETRKMKAHANEENWTMLCAQIAIETKKLKKIFSLWCAEKLEVPHSDPFSQKRKKMLMQ